MSAPNVQPTLFDPPAVSVRRPRRRTSATQDYAKVQPYARTQQGVILIALRAYGGMTRHEIAAVTGISLQSVCGRVRELLDLKAAREQMADGRYISRDGRHVVEATFTVRAG